MQKIRQFFTQMDRQALRSVGVVLCMFTLVVVMLLVARANFQLSQDGLMAVLSGLKGSPWGLPVTILAFTAAAFIGAPQWLLIAATVLAFGPQMGGVYAWLATLFSASFDFWLAKYIGAARVEALSGKLLSRVISLVRRNGMLFSFAVRLVPTGPFVLVNMAAGVSGLRFGSFFVGTSLGIIPKILVVVLLGQGALTAAQGERFMLIAIVGAIATIGIMLLARRILRPHVETPQRPKDM